HSIIFFKQVTGGIFIPTVMPHLCCEMPCTRCIKLFEPRKNSFHVLYVSSGNTCRKLNEQATPFSAETISCMHKTVNIIGSIRQLPGMSYSTPKLHGKFKIFRYLGGPFFKRGC